jgi:hypothetical protein
MNSFKFELPTHLSTMTDTVSGQCVHQVCQLWLYIPPERAPHHCCQYAQWPWPRTLLHTGLHQAPPHVTRHKISQHLRSQLNLRTNTKVEKYENHLTIVRSTCLKTTNLLEQQGKPVESRMRGLGVTQASGRPQSW